MDADIWNNEYFISEEECCASGNTGVWRCIWQFVYWLVCSLGVHFSLTDLYVVLVYTFFLWYSSLIGKGSHLFVNDWQATRAGRNVSEKINFRDCRFSGSKRQHLGQAHQEDPIHVHWCRGACPSVCRSVSLPVCESTGFQLTSSHVSVGFQCLRVYNREVKVLAVLPSYPSSGSFFLT